MLLRLLYKLQDNETDSARILEGVVLLPELILKSFLETPGVLGSQPSSRVVRGAVGLV